MQTIRLLAAVAAIALAVLASGCAVTSASRKSPDGQSEWSSGGIAVFETPADGYAKTARADATLLTVQSMAATNAAAVQSAYAAAASVRGGAKDEVARTGVALLALDVACRDGDEAACKKLEAAMRRKGGAR